MKRAIDILTPAKKGVLRPVGHDLIVSEPEANPKLSTVGHIVLIVIFAALMITYTVLALTWHFTRPDEESFSQRATGTLPPINIRISASCDNPPLCGDLTIAANYSDPTAVSYASGASGLSCTGMTVVKVLKNETASTLGAATPVMLPLCFIDDTVINPQLKTALPVPGIQINFAGINPGVNKGTTPHTKQANLTARGMVLVEAEDGSFSRTINMDSWQIKTLLVEQSIAEREDVIQTVRSHPMAIQYEGGRPNWRSTLLIQQTAFANIYSVSRPGNLSLVLAGIGGAFYICFSFVTLLALLLGVCCPGPLAIEERRIAKEKKEAKKKKREEAEAKEEEEARAKEGGEDEAPQAVPSPCKRVRRAAVTEI